MASLPSEYDHLIPHLEEELNDMTIEMLKQKLRPVYQRQKRRDNDGEDQALYMSEEESAMAATGSFKGRCYVCGKMGHKGITCPERKEVKGNWRFMNQNNIKYNGPARNTRSMICSYCGKRGHISKSCWQKNDDVKSAKAFLASVEEENEDENENEEEILYDNQEQEELVMASIEDNKMEERPIRPAEPTYQVCMDS